MTQTTNTRDIDHQALVGLTSTAFFARMALDGHLGSSDNDGVDGATLMGDLRSRLTSEDPDRNAGPLGTELTTLLVLLDAALDEHDEHELSYDARMHYRRHLLEGGGGRETIEPFNEDVYELFDALHGQLMEVRDVRYQMGELIDARGIAGAVDWALEEVYVTLNAVAERTGAGVFDTFVAHVMPHLRTLTQTGMVRGGAGLSEEDRAAEAAAEYMVDDHADAPLAVALVAASAHQDPEAVAAVIHDRTRAEISVIFEATFELLDRQCEELDIDAPFLIDQYTRAMGEAGRPLEHIFEVISDQWEPEGAELRAWTYTCSDPDLLLTAMCVGSVAFAAIEVAADHAGQDPLDHLAAIALAVATSGD